MPSLLPRNVFIELFLSSWSFLFFLVGTSRCDVRTPQRGVPTIENDTLPNAEVDNGSEWWEHSHMETTLVKADDKGRVSIRGTRKGAKYLVTAENGGWWVMPAPKITVPDRIESPAGAWELRAATLESFYDKSKAW
jgi:hypothetical protein